MSAELWALVALAVGAGVALWWATRRGEDKANLNHANKVITAAEVRAEIENDVARTATDDLRNELRRPKR